DGGAGVDTLIGGTGDDTYIIDSTSDVVTEALNEGTDNVQSSVSYTLGSNLENLTLTGASAINGTGNTLNNTITGNASDNNLDGGTGVDTLIGGAGNDTYIVDSTTDTITENASEGTDTVQSSVSYTLGSNVENLTLTGASAINGTGNTLDNILTGNASDNTLDGGTGVDTLIGGLGNDTYIVDSTTDTITENASEGTDNVQSSVSYTLGSNVENLTLTGASAINGTGNTLNNSLTGNASDNNLDGGTGVDTLIGGLGNDTYIVDSTTDTITEALNEGTDTVQSSVSYILGTNLENLTLTGASAINGTGNTLDNTITGNAANNTLDGGAGNDTMVGGTGDDTYIIDSTSDVVTEALNEGTDTVQSSVSYTLGSNLENLTLTGASAINGTGNTLNNTITGNASDNNLDGGTGVDTLIGGLGNDTYIVDSTTDTITEALNEGTDTVQSSVSYTLGSNLENLTLTGASAINGTGNTLDNILTGNASDNNLDGGTGVDTLIGGAGNDTYIVDSTTDTITENASEGTDNVQSSVSYTLGSNLENLTLTGASAINGTGNTLNNTITGNASDNTLDGGAGVDTLIGGLGNDTYIVDSTTDTITENASEGTDTVQSSVSYTLGTNIENLTLINANGWIEAHGNSLDNIITGDNNQWNDLYGWAGNDTLIGGNIGNNLNGGVGNDTLAGGTGDDYLEGGDGNDTLNGGAGNNTLAGGTGTDIFWLDNTGGTTNTITDLSTGEKLAFITGLSFTPAATVFSFNATTKLLSIDLEGNSTVDYAVTLANFTQTTYDASVFTVAYDNALVAYAVSVV
ncbi:MAG: hypothetical protein H2174_04545, partial [Vampirovibrio sp.]|nr:hypothetical protein [Vampirovibrio sp.]